MVRTNFLIIFWNCMGEALKNDPPKTIIVGLDFSPEDQQNNLALTKKQKPHQINKIQDKYFEHNS